jgi:hypothetical protein
MIGLYRRQSWIKQKIPFGKFENKCVVPIIAGITGLNRHILLLEVSLVVFHPVRSRPYVGKIPVRVTYDD